VSPSRTRKPVVHARPRSELATAIVIGTVIVLGTVLLIWLMRPGSSASGAPGSGGGLFNRQPRISWLTFGALGVGGWLTWWVLRGQRRPARRISPVLRVIAVWVLVLFVYLILSVFWPDGIIKHYPSTAIPKQNPTQTIPPITGTSPTTTPTASTAAPASTAPPTTAKP
jgi:hypothetical protein